jgi:tetratricopeptide (TPR) repeat protein
VALGRLVEQGSVDLAQRLVAASWWFWNVNCYFREGRQWLDQVLAMDSARSAARGRALIGAGYLTQALDEPLRAMVLLEEALAVLRSHGEARDIAMAHRSLGRAALRLRDFERARSALEEALTMLRELDDAWGVAACLHNLGNVSTIQADYQKAEALYTEALQLRRQLGDVSGIASSLSNLGAAAVRSGEIERGVPLIEEALPLFQALGELSEVADGMSYLGHVARLRGEYERATALFEETLVVRRRLGTKWGLIGALKDLAQVALHQRAYDKASQLLLGALELNNGPVEGVMIVSTLEAVAELAAAWGDVARAARLLGAADAVRDSTGSPRSVIASKDYEQTVANLSVSIGAAEVTSELAAGRKIPLEQALADASAMLHPSDQRTGRQREHRSPHHTI